MSKQTISAHKHSKDNSSCMFPNSKTNIENKWPVH